MERLLRAEAKELTGAFVETKSVSCTLHYRLSDPSAARGVIDRVVGRVTAHDGVHVLHGHKVLEIAVVRPDKGEALESVRHRFAAQERVVHR